MVKQFMITFSEEQMAALDESLKENLMTSRSALFAVLLAREKKEKMEASTRRGPGRPRKEEEEEIANIPHPAELQNAWGTVTGKKPWEVSLLTRSEYDDVLAMNPLVKWPENPTTIEEYNRDRSLWTGRLIPRA